MEKLFKKGICVFILLFIFLTLFSSSLAKDTEKKLESWSGWLIDRDCIGINPANHSRMCNLLGSCYDSGLGIYLYDNISSINGSDLAHYLVFDGESKAMAKSFLTLLPDSWKNNITIKVTGYKVSKIPADEKELNVPETDSSKVAKYLDGIHITTIEAVYIEGVSTNKLPSPNISVNESKTTIQKETEVNINEVSKWSISIKVSKSKTVTLTSAQFAKLAKTSAKTTQKCNMEGCKNKDMMNRTQTWSGVTLRTVLNYLGIKKFKSVTVAGKDGYTKSYLPAIVNAKGTLLATGLDGKNLDSTSGPIELIAADQKENLWVKNVAKIIIN